VTASAGGGAAGPGAASAGNTASARGRASAVSGGEGQGASGDCQTTPITAVVVSQRPLRVLPASADRPKPAKPCLRHVSATPPVPDADSLVPPPRQLRPSPGRAVLVRASAAAGARAEIVSASAAPSKEADKSVAVVTVLDDSGDELRDLLDSTSTRRSAPPSRGSGGSHSAVRCKSTTQRSSFPTITTRTRRCPGHRRRSDSDGSD